MSSRAATQPGRAVLGAVLAGGASSRMGAAKTVSELAGRPLIAYPIEAVSAAGLEPVVVAKPDTPLPDLALRIVHDDHTTSHPAAGIIAALRAAEGRPIVVVACDMPFVPRGLLELLAGLEASVAIPRVGGRLEPLLARYAPSAMPVLKRTVARSGALGAAVAALDPLVVDEAELARFGEPAAMTSNVNDRAELAAAERLLAAGARP